MRPFEYHAPSTLSEAVALLGRLEGAVSLLAGGTDLLVEVKGRARRPDHLVDIKHIPDLAGLSWDPAAGLRVGALTTVRMVESSPIVALHYAGLAAAARSLGSIQIRNRATVAGNICRASPSADTPPPLIADGAAVRIAGPNGERVVPLESFFLGPGRSVLARDEILVEIAVPPPAPRTGKVYLKHGRRLAMELATVGVAVALTLDPDGDTQEVRVVLGAVAPTPIRARQAEAVLRGRVVDASLIAEAAEAAEAESRPISDVRSSADYRREMVRVLTGRALRQAFDAAMLWRRQSVSLPLPGTIGSEYARIR